MNLFNHETLLLTDPDVEILKREFQKRKGSFWKFLGAFIILLPIGPFLGRGQPFVHNFNDYKIAIIQLAIFVPSGFILIYSWTLYRIKKDLINRTKIRFKATIEKTKADSEIYKWGAKYCIIIINPIEKIIDKEKPKGLFYYLKKNIFPSQKFKIPIPVNIYPSLNNGEGTIEISTYSKTFLSFTKSS